jgi:hypothetical protein
VCVKRSVAEPRYAWGGETHHSVGKISEIGGDGLLLIDIPARPIPWQADPSDMEKAEDFKVLFVCQFYTNRRMDGRTRRERRCTSSSYIIQSFLYIRER